MYEITKIKLKTGGLKGADVSILVKDEKNGVTFMDSRTHEKTRPIHLGLEKLFKELRYHLLDICGIVTDKMTAVEKDLIINETFITVACIDGEGIRISGWQQIFGNKKLNLNPPIITPEDGYEHFESVEAIWNKIKEEANKYLSGEVPVSDEEYVHRWVEAGKEKGFDVNSFEALSPDEKKEFCQKVLEKSFGATVLMPDDVDLGEVDTKEVTNEFVLPKEAEEVVIPAAK